MFSSCSSLTSIDISKFNIEKVTSMSWMFAYCSSLISIDSTKFNTENDTNEYKMHGMFYECSSLKLDDKSD